MKTSELVKEEQINKLIMKNINSVMGFNKYAQLRKVSETMLAEKKAERMANDKIREEYSQLTTQKQDLEKKIEELKDEYAAAINYANEHKEQYDHLKEGKNADDITRDQMRKIEQSLENTVRQETEYRQDIDNLAKDLETKVIFLKLASQLKTEVDVILHTKDEAKNQRANILSDEQIESFTRNLVRMIEERYFTSNKIDVLSLINELKRQQEDGDGVEDKYDFLTTDEVTQLDKLVNTAIINPLTELDEKRIRLNQEIHEMPRQREHLREYQQALNGSDYTIIELYEANNKKIQELKDDIERKENEVKELGKKIATYDYDMPQIPDPQYDMLCKFLQSIVDETFEGKKG